MLLGIAMKNRIHLMFLAVLSLSFSPYEAQAVESSRNKLDGAIQELIPTGYAYRR
jgi:hypothetical protein